MLSAARCQAMLQDPTHIFRHLWATEGWGIMDTVRPCWSAPRKIRHMVPVQRPEHFFDGARRGQHCSSDWYEGHEGGMANFTAPAPALIGFDDDIAHACLARKRHEAEERMSPAMARREQLACYAARYPDVLAAHCTDQRQVASLATCDYSALSSHYERVGRHSRCKRTRDVRCCSHAHRCRHANLNILSLVGHGTAYNMCRNLEWLVCAALGKLPGQGGIRIRVATPLRDLAPDGLSRPLARCGGWHPTMPKNETGAYAFGYTNDDIFYLEVCLLAAMCTNAETLFKLRVGEEFTCEFSTERFASLAALLRTPNAPRSSQSVVCNSAVAGRHYAARAPMREHTKRIPSAVEQSAAAAGRRLQQAAPIDALSTRVLLGLAVAQQETAPRPVAHAVIERSVTHNTTAARSEEPQRSPQQQRSPQHPHASPRGSQRAPALPPEGLLILQVCATSRATIHRVLASLDAIGSDAAFAIVLYDGSHADSWTGVTEHARRIPTPLHVRTGRRPPSAQLVSGRRFYPKLQFWLQALDLIERHAFVWLADEDISFRNCDVRAYWHRLHTAFSTRGAPLISQPTIRALQTASNGDPAGKWDQMLNTNTLWSGGACAGVVALETSFVEQQAAVVDTAFFVSQRERWAALAKLQHEHGSDFALDTVWCGAAALYVGQGHGTRQTRVPCAIITLPITHADTRTLNWTSSDKFAAASHRVERLVRREVAPDWWAAEADLIRTLSRHEIRMLRHTNHTCEASMPAITERVVSPAARDGQVCRTNWSKATRLPCCYAQMQCFPHCFNHVGEIVKPCISAEPRVRTGIERVTPTLVPLSVPPITSCYPSEQC